MEQVNLKELKDSIDARKDYYSYAHKYINCRDDIVTAAETFYKLASGEYEIPKELEEDLNRAFTEYTHKALSSKFQLGYEEAFRILLSPFVTKKDKDNGLHNNHS
ncbi:MAG: hypothetical protein AABW88_02260 [Nanoarchaeota archaeon]